MERELYNSMLVHEQLCVIVKPKLMGIAAKCIANKTLVPYEY